MQQTYEKFLSQSKQEDNVERAECRRDFRDMSPGYSENKYTTSPFEIARV